MAAARERILVADDDDAIRRATAALLQKAGYRVLEAANGREALERAESDRPALLIVDIEMPEMGGLATIERLRKTGNPLPVLVISGRGSLEQRVEGLEIGADDYLAKPYEHAELLARVRALLRRHERKAPSLVLIQVGDVLIDLATKQATHAGKVTRLSAIECAILKLLAQNAGRPVGREEMLDVVWGYTYLPSTRTIDTHIWRLRKKLGDGGKEPRWLKNVPGAGYVLDIPPPGRAEAEGDGLAGVGA
jgi:two-component system, OmpR family, response regulator MprA